mgnify:CR=1 FL=1
MTSAKSSLKNTPVRRSFLKADPVLPFSTENILVREINDLLCQTISLEDNVATNSLVKQNFSCVFTKLDTLLLRSLSSVEEFTITEYKRLVDDLELSPRVKILVEKIIQDHLIGLKTPEYCHCEDILNNKAQLMTIEDLQKFRNMCYEEWKNASESESDYEEETMNTTVPVTDSHMEDTQQPDPTWTESRDDIFEEPETSFLNKNITEGNQSDSSVVSSMVTNNKMTDSVQTDKSFNLAVEKAAKLEKLGKSQFAAPTWERKLVKRNAALADRVESMATDLKNLTFRAAENRKENNAAVNRIIDMEAAQLEFVTNGGLEKKLSVNNNLILTGTVTNEKLQQQLYHPDLVMPQKSDHPDEYKRVLMKNLDLKGNNKLEITILI